jgi:hypothetical protein
VGTNAALIQAPQAALKVSSVEDAFRRALSAVHGGVDLQHPSGWVSLARGGSNHWMVVFRSYPELANGLLRVRVFDRGETELLDGPLERSPAKARTRIPVPRVALHLALERLTEHVGRDVDWGSARGTIRLSRTQDQKWYVSFDGYHAIPWQGLMVTIDDDLRVNLSSSP